MNKIGQTWTAIDTFSDYKINIKLEMVAILFLILCGGLVSTSTIRECDKILSSAQVGRRDRQFYRRTFIKLTDDEGGLCGSLIYDNKTLITAAHCVSDMSNIIVHLPDG